MRIEFKKFYIRIWSTRLVLFSGRLIGLPNAYAFAFWPIMCIRPDKAGYHRFRQLVNHEEIHLCQQLELLLIPAEILYYGEIIYARWIKKLPTKQAYYFVAAEQEAHRNEENFDYLKTRKPYAMFRYYKDKKKLSRDKDENLIVEEF